MPPRARRVSAADEVAMLLADAGVEEGQSWLTTGQVARWFRSRDLEAGYEWYDLDQAQGRMSRVSITGNEYVFVRVGPDQWVTVVDVPGVGDACWPREEQG